MFFAFAGFLAGLTHVFCGPDHLTAVAPFAVNDRSKSWLAGLRWGVGHATGFLLIGFFLIMLRDRLPLNVISSWSERITGAVLISIGFWALRQAFSMNLHCHEHIHEGETHIHIHFHESGRAHALAHSHSHALFGIGALHGLAGSSHFFGILPALAFPTQLGAVVYTLAFGFGTILGMICFSASLGWVARYLAMGQIAIYRLLLYSTGALAFVAGSYWVFR